MTQYIVFKSNYAGFTYFAADVVKETPKQVKIANGPGSRLMPSQIVARFDTRKEADQLARELGVVARRYIAAVQELATATREEQDMLIRTAKER